MTRGTNIAVLGGGAWGTALASMLADAGRDVTLWARSAKTVAEISNEHRNHLYLGDIALSAAMTATTDLSAISQASLVLCVVPAQETAGFLPELKRDLSSEVPVLLCSKGIDRNGGKLLSEIAEAALPGTPIGALSGPSFAVDVARGLPTAVTLATRELSLAEALCSQLSTGSFRPYASADVSGVEIGGALKNVLAIAVGAARGMGLGASAEAALIARGFAELKRLAVPFGAKPETLSGLSGLGDLVLTCSSTQSRNFLYGMTLGRGESVDGLPLAEGAYTASIAARLAAEKQVSAPITDAVTAVLSGDISARDAVTQLLARPLKVEQE